MRALLALAAALGASGCSLLVSTDNLSSAADAAGVDGGADGSPADACPTPCIEIVAREEHFPLGIAVAGGTVYWVNQMPPNLRARSSDLATGARSIDVPSDNLLDPFDIAVDAMGMTLYWSEQSGNKVVKRPLTGGARTELNAIGAGYIALGPNGVFVTNYNAAGTAVIINAQKDQSLYTANGDSFAGIAFSGTLLYWSRTLGNIITYAGPAGGTPEHTAVIDAGSPGGLAVDDDSIYWLAGNQTLMQQPFGSGNPVMRYRAKDSFDGGDVAVDGQYVYWTENKNGLVLRLPKK